MKKGKKLYEGKAKIIYATNEKSLVIQHFKDDATAGNRAKEAKFQGKGELNCSITTKIFERLSFPKKHFIKKKTAQQSPRINALQRNLMQSTQNNERNPNIISKTHTKK